MARLATTVLKSFPNRVARLDTLFAYLAENGENITDMVGKRINLQDLYIVSALGRSNYA